MAFTPLAKVSSLLVLGLATAIGGFVFYLFFPAFVKTKMDQMLILTEDSMIYEQWKETQFPIYTKFYFFNVINPTEVYQEISKPIVEELGPYTFRETRIKTNITWHSNGTVSYRQLKRFYYRPDLSNGSLDDVITTINIPLLVSSAKADELNSVVLDLALSTLYASLDSNGFINKTVRELLFEGYDDPILTTLRKFVKVPYDKFGWMYKRNDTASGLYTVFTGQTSRSKIGKIDRYNGLSYISSLKPPCNSIQVSAGEVFPPIQTDDNIPAYIPELCRTMHAVFMGERVFRDITAYRYYGDHTNFDNGQRNLTNKCYCSKSGCLPAGGYDTSSCPPGAPIIVSYPHFLFGDSIYHEGVTGLRPDPKKHTTYMDINPETGLLLRANLGVQLNIVFEGNEGISQFSANDKKIYFPVMWFSTSFTLPEDLTSRIKFVLYGVPLIVNVISFFLLGFGTTLVLSAFILAIVYLCQRVQPKYVPVASKSTDLKDFKSVQREKKPLRKYTT